MTSPHSLLLASAGTGKTYRLATHFAALLSAGVEPAKVLATTFTRKAAGEILDRVLARLVEAALDGARGEAARAGLAAAARRIGAESRTARREDALERLAELARRVGRFQVRTLDSFFVHVARLFAYELALMPEWHIADDVEDDEQRAEVLARVIADLGPEERLTLLQAIARTGAPTASHSGLAGAIDAALTLHRDAVPGAWEVVEPDPAPDEARVRDAVHVVSTFRLPTKKDGAPYSRWVDFQRNACDALERADWRRWLALTLVKNVSGGDERFDRVPVPRALADAVLVLVEAALAAETAELVASNHATGRLCDLYVACERTVKDRTGAYRFDDFPRALAAGPGGADDEDARELWRMDLGYRLDTRVAHLLLDEFQDTAPLQWRLLLPLAEELLAGATDDDGTPRTFFCVGDVKQSIYGWREAEPRLLGEMHTRHPVLVPEVMTESWRSSEIVLDTVNRLFDRLDERAVFGPAENDALRERAAEWLAGFAPHRRAAGAGPCAGAAVLLEALVPAGTKPLDACLGVAAERVAALAARQPNATIAVLLRSKQGLPRLLYLLRERGVEASGEGGNPLTDAPLVTQSLALLHLADHPDDRLAALAVVHSPFAAEFGLDGLRADDPQCRPAFRAAAGRVRRELVEDGYGAFFGRLAALAGPGASDWDRTRFGQLVELALAYDARAGLRPAAFAALVRRERVESPTAARVRVMTVHASKGLEFDAVFLPQLAESLTGRPSRHVSFRPGPLEPTTVLSGAPLRFVAGRREDLGGLVLATRARALVDELSVLYVAATRAIHHLELIVPPCAKSEPVEPPLRAAELVREALTGQTWSQPREAAPAADGEEGAETEATPRVLARELWTHPGSDLVWQVREGHGRSGAPAALPARPLALAAAPAPRETRVHTPTSADARGEDAAALLAQRDRPARALGTLVHALFEGLEWLEDDARSDEDLRRCLARHTTDGAQVEHAVARFRAALATDAVRAALARPTPAPGERVEVLTERAFDVELADEGEDAGTWRGAIDRLVLVRRGETVVRAEVLDFKTDDVTAATVAERTEHHRPQLDAYRRVVVALYGVSPDAVRASLLFVGPGLRVDV